MCRHFSAYRVTSLDSELSTPPGAADVTPMSRGSWKTDQWLHPDSCMHLGHILSLCGADPQFWRQSTWRHKTEESWREGRKEIVSYLFYFKIFYTCRWGQSSNDCKHSTSQTPGSCCLIRQVTCDEIFSCSLFQKTLEWGFFSRKHFLFRFIKFKTRRFLCGQVWTYLQSALAGFVPKDNHSRVSGISTPNTISASSFSFHFLPQSPCSWNYRQAVASIYLCSFTLLAATSIVHTHSALVHREFCLRVDGVGNPAFCLPHGGREGNVEEWSEWREGGCWAPCMRTRWHWPYMAQARASYDPRAFCILPHSLPRPPSDVWRVVRPSLTRKRVVECMLLHEQRSVTRGDLCFHFLSLSLTLSISLAASSFPPDASHEKRRTGSTTKKKKKKLKERDVGVLISEVKGQLLSSGSSWAWKSFCLACAAWRLRFKGWFCVCFGFRFYLNLKNKPACKHTRSFANLLVAGWFEREANN